MTRFYYDCEFVEDGHTIDLISIGIVADTDPGREYYAVSADINTRRILAHPWLRCNVWPHLPLTDDDHLDRDHPDVKPRHQIAAEVLAFLTRDAHAEPELWARWGAYDHVCLMWLWGDMAHKPSSLPFYTRDVQQEIDRLTALLGRDLELPTQEVGAHHALADAQHALVVARALTTIAAQELSPIRGGES